MIMPVRKDLDVEATAIRAAKWLIAAKARYRDRYRHATRPRYHDREPPVPTKEPTIRDAAAIFKTARSGIGRQFKALVDTGRPLDPGAVGRPRSLRDDEDAALTCYARWLIESGASPARKLIEDGANLLRSRRVLPEGPVCSQWWRRWRANNPWLQTVGVKKHKPIGS
jgi:hypothetical protein